MHRKSEKHIQIYLQFTNIKREKKYHMNHVTLSHCDMIHTLYIYSYFVNTQVGKFCLNLIMEHHGDGTSQIMKHHGNPKVDDEAGHHNQRQHLSLWTGKFPFVQYFHL